MKFKNILHIILIGVACVSTISCAERPKEIKATMPDRASAALKTALSLEDSKSDDIKELFLEGRYSDIENLVSEYSEKMKSNPLYESPLIKVFNKLAEINVDQEIMLEGLDKWTSSRPSAISFTASGGYKVLQAHKVRGTDLIDDTPPEAIHEMQFLLSSAKEDLIKSLVYNNKFSPTYAFLIHKEQLSGSLVEASKFHDTGIQTMPDSYYIREAYMQALQPSWLGSYAQMEAYTATLDQAPLLNPRIWSLKGFPDLVRGDSALINGDNTLGLSFLTRSLSYGERVVTRLKRARLYSELGSYDLALADYLVALKFDKNNREAMFKVSELSSIVKQPAEITLPK